MFFWVLWAALVIEPEEGSWEPPIYSQFVRSTGNNLDLKLASEGLGMQVGVVFGLSELIAWWW